jgi:hypothetical protein
MQPWAKKWMMWGFVLVLNLVMFFVLRLIAHRTAWEFAGPYLVTFVAPMLIFMLAVTWLRKWEKHKPPPRVLAFCWSLAMAVFVGGINSALFYFGSKFGVFDPDLGDFVFVVGLLTLSAALATYFQMLPMITARANTDPR